MAWRICEWNARFEPPKRNQSRKGLRRLDWVRMKVRGRLWDPEYRTMLQLCGQPDDLTGFVSPFVVLGVFAKLVEFASEADVTCRDGTIYDDRGMPADLNWIRKASGGDEEALMAALPILSNPELGWIEEIPPEKVEVPAANFQPRPESGTQLKPTGSNRDQLITDEDEDEDEERERERDEEREPSPLSSSRKARTDQHDQDLSGSLPGDSSFSDSVSDLVRVRQTTVLRLATEIFPGKRTEKQAKSDLTTFRRIVNQLVHSEAHAEKVLAAARDSQAGDKPVATFVDAAKRMGYQPRGREKHA